MTLTYTVLKDLATGTNIINCRISNLAETRSGTLEQLKHVLAELRDENYVLDISRAEWVSLSLLKELVLEFRKTRARGHNPRLVVGPYFNNLIEVYGCSELLKPHTTLEAALKD